MSHGNKSASSGTKSLIWCSRQRYMKKILLVDLRNSHLTQILTFSGKRSPQLKKPGWSLSMGTPRTQTRHIGLSMSRVELLQDTWTDRRVERC